MKPPAEEKKR
jgi:kinesin family protein 2/24